MSDCGNVKKVFVKPKQEATAVLEPEAPTAAPIVGIVISDIAAEKIIQFLEADGKSPADYGLWVGVTKDGCSGNSYLMDLKEKAPSIESKDKLFAHANGAQVFVDKISYFKVAGSILDYTEALTGSGFTFNNPNIKKSCSCGSSFAV